VLFENQYKFVINLDDAIAWIGKRTHDSGAACGIACGNLLPNNGTHIIKSGTLAELDDFSSYRDYLVSTVIYRTGKLIAYIDAETTSIMQNPVAFTPYEVQIIDILLVGIVKSYLAFFFIIF